MSAGDHWAPQTEIQAIPEPARPRRGASDAPVPGAASERQGQDELAFDRQKEPQKHTNH